MTDMLSSGAVGADANSDTSYGEVRVAGQRHRALRPRPAMSWPAEVALVGVTVAVAVSMARAFDTWQPLGSLLVVAALAHGVALSGRLLRMPALLSTIISLAVGATVITVLYYYDLSWMGLPTTDVFLRAVDDAHAAFEPFQKLVPPVAPTPGFEITLAVGLWLIATFADLAAGRSDAPVQAVLPHVVTFVFTSVLLLGRYSVLSASLFMTSLVFFTLATRTERVARGPSTVALDAVRPVPHRTSTRNSWAIGLPMLAIVAVGGLVASQVLPAPDDKVVDLRSIGRGPKSRVVESPLVSLDSLLGAQSNNILFTVRSANPHYWRLTALDDFDGRSWSASARYRDLKSGDDVAATWGPEANVSTEEISFAMGAFENDWLPAAFSPRRVDTNTALRFDDSSSSIFLPDGVSASGLTYTVSSEIAALDPAALSAATIEDGDLDARDDYLALPDNFSPQVADLAENLTADAGPLQASLALQSYFRDGGFLYQRTVDYRASPDPLVAFLEARTGFCQQFATAFAAMARSVGLPARVAVGFTYGDQNPDEPDVWVVRGRYAHAWPEVYIAGTGWVAFEPTPGRGNPDAQAYSGVDTQQSDERGGSVGLGTDDQPASTTIAPVAGGVVPTTATTTPSSDVDVADLPPPATRTTAPSRSGRTITVAMLALIAAAAVAVAGRIAFVRRRLRRRHDHQRPPADRIDDSWRQMCRDAARLGISTNPAETPAEFGKRAAPALDVPEVVALARHESDRRFRSQASTDDEADQAERIAGSIRQVVWSRLDRRNRLAAELDL